VTSNAYASLDEFLAQPEITSDAPVDDVFIEDLLARASRAADGFCGVWFYANTQTRSYNMPRGRELELDAPLLSVTSITNGDGTSVAASSYTLYPLNGPHFTSIKLTPGNVWVPDVSSGADNAISVTGTWGYVDRNATDPESMIVITNTTDAVLATALAAYKKRYGSGTEGVAQVTGAGVVITPRGMPVDAKQLLTPYVRHM
jgi:hypothetical protein